MSNAVTIFDLDNTLIKGDSSTLWSQFMVREGWVSDPEYLAREALLMADYDRGEMNIADYVALIQAPLIGIPVRRWIRWWRDSCAKGVAAGLPAGMGRYSDPTGAREKMLVISASVTLLVQAIAAELGIEQALGIDVEMADGGYSGVIAGTPSYQQGKVTRTAQWREAHPDYTGEVTFIPIR